MYYEKLTYNNLLDCFKKVKSSCKNKRLVHNFEKNLYINIYDIYNSLLNRNYKFDKYNIFIIHKPKRRVVMSESIKDKIVSCFISDYLLKPLINKHLIHSNVATRIDKGSKLAYNLFEGYVNNFDLSKKLYVLRIDISKYFYNIDHETILKKIKSIVKDKFVNELLETLLKRTNEDYVNNLINSFNLDVPIYKKNKGLSIGNICSQLLAVFYLSETDHYVKESLLHKCYVRYMDDLIIIDNDKDKLKISFSLITEHINKNNLKVNPKSRIHTLNHGFTFLAFTYHIKNNKLIKRVKNNNYRNILKKLKYLKRHNIEKYKLSLISYRGYSKVFLNNI